MRSSKIPDPQRHLQLVGSTGANQACTNTTEEYGCCLNSFITEFTGRRYEMSYDMVLVCSMFHIYFDTL